MGYGFVEMDSEEDAKKAVTLMHKKEVNGRQINVEVAKPQDETKKPREPKVAADGEDAAPARPRNRRRPAKTTGDGKSEATDEGRPKPRPPRRAPTADGESDEGAAPRKPRAPRGPKPTGLAPRRSNEPREESKTTLFVANLPFNLNDDEFAKILTEKQLKLKSAHVVTKKNGKSKGYGFVEFDNQEDQQKALAALHKTTIDSRELSVKVALNELKLQEEDKAALERAAPTEKKATPTAEKKAASPAPKPASGEKKVAVPLEKNTASPSEKKVAAPGEKKTETAEKKVAAPAEKKVATPTAEKKTATPEKK